MKYSVFIIIFLFFINILYAREYDFSQVKGAVLRYLTDSRFENALELLYDYKKTDPKNCEVYQEIAQVYKLMNDFNNAKRVYRKGIEEFTNCRLIFHYELGMLSYKTGDYRDVIVNMNKLIKKLSEEPEENSEYTNVYKVLGISYLLTSNWTNAIKYLNLHRKIDFRNEETYKQLSTAYRKYGDNDYYNAFSEINNLLIRIKGFIFSDDTIYNQMASIFFKYAKYNDAKTNLLEIYEQKRMEYRFNFNLGLACFLTGDNEEAIKYLERTVKFYDNNFSIKKIFSKLFRIDKTGAKYLLTLSMVYHMNKKRDEAIKTFERIKEYSSSVYKKYKLDFTGSSTETLYKEIKNAWEY